ncbi:MAG: NACHT domain-containing protein [Panacagrimonas sp.]
MSATLTQAQYESEALYWYRQQLSRATEKITLLGLPTLWMELARTDDPLLRQLFVTPAVSPLAQEAKAEEPDATGALHPLDALHEHRQVVLLGAPGSGKSTLGQWLVWYACQQSGEAPDWFRPLVPVLLSLRDLKLGGLPGAAEPGEAAASLKDLLDRHAQVQSTASGAYAQVGPVVDAAIAAGQALLVVDGYDEVPADQLPALRALLRRALRQDPGNVWVITSRPVGYDAAPLHRRDRPEDRSATPEAALPASAVLHLQPFDDRRIHSFADAWYRLMSPGPEEGRGLSERFQRTVADHPGTRTLARTPNLLALMVMVFRQRQLLPDGRAELYGLITEAYLESIDAARFGRNRGEVGDEVPLKVKRQWLARLGFEMQRQRQRASQASESLVFDREMVLGWLREAITATHPQLAAQENFVEFYLRWLQARTGLLIERGQNQFSFVHLSFQEYFCALYLAAEFSHREFGRCQSPEEARELGMDPRVNPVTLWHWAHRAEWQEVYVFAAEHLASLGPNVRAWLEAFLGRRFCWLRGGRFGGDDRRAGLAVRLLLNPHAGCERFAEDLFAATLGWLDALGHGKNVRWAEVRSQVIARLLGAPFWAQKLWAHWEGRAQLSLSRTGITDLSPLASMASLQSLDLTETPVTDLTPLAGMASLQSLNLTETPVTDLSPLAGMASLQSLKLWGTPVTDLSPLVGMTSLQSLKLWGTPVTDLSPLAGMASLQTLVLWDTPVKDFSPLAAMTSLQSLDLSWTPVSDLSPLAGITSLRSLDLSWTPVSDLSPLAGITSLQSLILSETPVMDLSPLASIASLQLLNLSRTPVTALGPLAGMVSLQSLVLWQTPVSDLSPLAGMVSLRSLDLSRTPVADLSPLAGMASLRSLVLSGTPVADLSPLAGMASLRSLVLSETQVTNLGSLAGMASLQLLNLSRTSVADLSPLAGMASLQSLVLSETPVADLGPLTDMASLLDPHPRRTPVADLGPLAGMASLQSLDLSGTQVTDLSPLLQLPALQGLTLPAAIDELALWPLHSLVERGGTLD